MEELLEKKKQLESMLEKLVKKGICIAFSGGVDSSALLAAAVKAQEKQGGTVFGVMFDTFLHPKGDEAEAGKVAMECGAEFAVISVNELDNPAILENPMDRCYQCKRFLFTRLGEFAKKRHCAVLMDGTNANDKNAYRPGLRALAELEVLSPLAELGFTKAEVRELAALYGISVASKPSNSCLATRVPYGEHLDKKLLEKIGAGEAYLTGLGFTSVRIRVHGDIARIEIDASQLTSFINLREDIVKNLKEIGFVYITLDVEGFRSGSMDL